MKSKVRAVVCETARVFTREGKNGNWLGVVTDTNGLTKADMRAVAKTLNFSETSFVFPADSTSADYRVRFFTPQKEIPFAGHPSLGTLFIMLQLGLLPVKKRYIQLIGKRKVILEVLPDGLIRMDQGTPVYGKTVPPGLVEKMLGVKGMVGEPQVVSTGLPHLVVPLRTMADLKNAKLRQKQYKEMLALTGAPCVMPFCISGDKVHCRMFAPALGIKEDPATGSGCGPLASYIVKHGLLLAPRGGGIAVTQGVKKTSLLFAWVQMKKGTVQKVSVGGFSVHCRRRTIFI